jgi:hypothetical protein
MALKENALGAVNAMANISAQTAEQRNQFAGESGKLGASRTVMSNLFNIAERGDEEYINTTAYNNSVALYIENKYTGSGAYMNPDFSTGSLAENQLGYDAFPSTTEIEASHEALSDAPNTFGPNINTHKFNADGSPDVNEAQISSPTFVDEGQRGFGSNFERNKIDKKTFGSYLRRKKVEGLPPGQEPRLGVYVDVDGYLTDADEETEEQG